jgi:hypothetical protein
MTTDLLTNVLGGLSIVETVSEFALEGLEPTKQALFLAADQCVEWIEHESPNASETVPSPV